MHVFIFSLLHLLVPGLKRGTNGCGVAVAGMYDAALDANERIGSGDDMMRIGGSPHTHTHTQTQTHSISLSFVGHLFICSLVHLFICSFVISSFICLSADEAPL